MIKIWFKQVGDSTPTFFSDINNDIDRPDESFFVSDIPVDRRVTTYTIIWDGTVPTLIRNTDADATILEGIRERQKKNIARGFDDTPGRGILVSLGYRVNATRVDKDNVRSLIDYCQSKGLSGIDSFRIFDNSNVAVTLAELQQIHDEIVEFALGLYQRKWAKATLIDGAADKAAVVAITWESVE